MTPPEEEERSIEPIISSFTERAYTEPTVDQVGKKGKEQQQQQTEEDSVPPITFTEVENKDYELPPIHLLKAPRHTDQSGEYELIHANAAKLERTFLSFGVKAKVTQVHLGPAVTKYEVHPDVGVKVSKIVNLSDDLALALAAKDIRMEAPIPGKSAIGIEVPNSEVAMVSLREVLESKKNDRPEAKLMIGLGRDITGEAVLAELNKMPHLLVAGATGSGKSVCINGIITSILMRAKPHEVKLMMIDPKMVELNVYNGVPHLLAPVVTDPKKASQALKKVVSEMERRYELFSHTGTRNIEGYNDYIRRINMEEDSKQPLLPYIVVIVDELADLMMVASSDVEDAITRLAQMARAAGIHLIIATQRPSVDVITGVIKANIPSRIAFAVSSQIDSGFWWSRKAVGSRRYVIYASRCIKANPCTGCIFIG
jgi:S-DNA-T family DNA segregation ATPase FtsK/SpoIIIE